MTDIFGIIPDAKPPKGKEGHVQDIFGTWYDPRVKEQPRQSYSQPRQNKQPKRTQQKPEQPKQRGYVAESYVQTGKDIVKGVRLGIKGAKYLNNLRKEHAQKHHTIKITEEKEFYKPQPTARDIPFKVKQDF